MFKSGQSIVRSAHGISPVNQVRSAHGVSPINLVRPAHGVILSK